MSVIHVGAVATPTSRLLECINMTEFNALDDKDRDIIAMVIGSSVVDFRQGSPIWNLIHSFFPDGTTTWINMVAKVTHDYTPLPI